MLIFWWTKRNLMIDSIEQRESLRRLGAESHEIMELHSKTWTTQSRLACTSFWMLSDQPVRCTFSQNDQHSQKESFMFLKEGKLSRKYFRPYSLSEYAMRSVSQNAINLGLKPGFFFLILLLLLHLLLSPLFLLIGTTVTHPYARSETTGNVRQSDEETRANSFQSSRATMGTCARTQKFGRPMQARMRERERERERERYTHACIYRAINSKSKCQQSLYFPAEDCESMPWWRIKAKTHGLIRTLLVFWLWRLKENLSACPEEEPSKQPPVLEQA